MDPQAALDTIRDLYRQILLDNEDSDDCMELAEEIEALDDWITRGGFLPENWDNEPADGDEKGATA